ncbi:MAG: hypothetical protein JW765_05805 [Deltaproteobacteria bacterium]|nr:hypothetical protein [Candidatus Zymogenaceae bacterium]
MRKNGRLLSLLVLCTVLVVLSMSAPAAEEGSGVPGTYGGYLFSKLDNIGTKSEGRSYYLQLWDDSEIHIIKNGILWQSDPELDALLDTKVTITGIMEDGQLRYTKIEPFKW